MSPQAEHRAVVEEAKGLLGELAQTDVNLGMLTTYRVGGNAALYVEARNEEDL